MSSATEPPKESEMSDPSAELSESDGPGLLPQAKKDQENISEAPKEKKSNFLKWQYVTIIIIFLAVLIHEMWLSTRASFLIDTILVPKHLAEKEGLSGTVIANQLRDGLAEIAEALKSDTDDRFPNERQVPQSSDDPRSHHDFTVPAFSPRKDIQIPALGISFQLLAEWIVDTIYSSPFTDLGRERVTGELVTLSDELNLSLRINGVSISDPELSASKDNIESLYNDASQTIAPHLIAILSGLPRDCNDPTNFLDKYISLATKFSDTGLTKATLATLRYIEETCASKLNSPLFSSFYQFQGERYFYIDDYEKSISSFLKVISLDEQDDLPNYFLGLIHNISGNPELAEQRLLLSQRTFQDDPYVQQELGVAFANQKKFKLSDEAFEKARSQIDNDADFWLTWARSLADAGRHVDAEAKLKTADSLRSNDHEILWGWGSILREIGEYELAIGKLSRAVEMAPADQTVRTELGYTMVEVHDYRKALLQFDAALETNSEYSPAYVGKCYALRRARQRDRAAENCRKAVRVDSQNIDAWIELGWLQWERKEFESAIESFERAISLEYDNPDGPLGLAWSLLRINQHSKAMATFDHAFELSGKSPEVLIEWCEALIELRRFAEAEHRLAKILAEGMRISPVNESWIYELQALIKIEQNDAVSAQNLYKKAIETDKYNAWAFSGLGASLLKQSKFKEANQAFVIAREKFPHFAELYADWGWALLENGNYSESIKKFQSSLVVDANLTDGMIGLAEAKLALEEFDDAKSVLEHARKTDPHNSSILVTLGDILMDEDKTSAAMRLYQEASQLNSAEVEGLVSLAKAHETVGDPRAALEAYADVIRRDPDGRLGASAKAAIAASDLAVPGRHP